MESMRAIVFESAGKPIKLAELPIPVPGSGQVLLKVQACGVCHTDLHILKGELKKPKLPLVLGHQIVGTVVQAGQGAERFLPGERVGIPWLGGTDGTCRYCKRGQENLCDDPTFTGYNIDGGFAEYTIADERFCFPLPSSFSDIDAAPLLCAGLIGYRTYRMTGKSIETLGIYGFGAAAHIITQVAKYEGKKVFAFTRPGDKAAQEFALLLGADWAGDFQPDSARRAGRGIDLRPSWCPGCGSLKGHQQRRSGGMRGNPYERYPGISLLHALGRTGYPICGQSHPPGRRGIPLPGSAGTDQNEGDPFSP